MDINHDAFHFTASISFRDSLECQLHEGTGDTKMEQVLVCSLTYLVNIKRVTLENTTENTTEWVPCPQVLTVYSTIYVEIGV